MSFLRASDLPTSYVSYDLETTGLGTQAQIIEIGAVRVIDRGEDERFDTFVALDEGVHIEPAAARLTHISEDMLAGAPSVEEAYRQFAEFVGDFPLVGQNIRRFDNAFVNRAARRAQLPSVVQNGCYDTMLLFRKVVGGPANLAAICQYYGIQNEQAHRAWADARATSDCYLAILHDAESLTVEARGADAPVVAHELDGEVVCFTGNTREYPKLMCETVAVRHGALLAHKVSHRTTLLVCLEPHETNNVRRARQLGCPMMAGDEFLARLGLTSEDLRRR
ncbi:MAG: exonuclease domain-containing protein [Atopobiaceae bacterium]